MLNSVIKTLAVISAVIYTYLLYRQGKSYYGDEHDDVWSERQIKYNDQSKRMYYYIMALLVVVVAALGCLIFEHSTIVEGSGVIALAQIGGMISVMMLPFIVWRSGQVNARWRREYGVGYLPDSSLVTARLPVDEPAPGAEAAGPPAPPPLADALAPAEPDTMPGHFPFRCAPIWECPLFGQFLSEQTQRSLLRSEWARSLSLPSGGSPEVFLCEAHGGADAGELAALFAAIAANGQRVIVVWTDDWPFPVASSAELLVFDIMAPPPRGCGYTWEASKYGPAQIPEWKPFTERPILASFIGSRGTHACREILFDEAVIGRPDLVIEDVDWWNSMKADGGAEFRTAKAARFADVLANSKFALCPRGNGPSSKRRWEAAYVGAVPLLIDDLTQPFGLRMPMLDFRSGNGGSVHDDALALLARLVEAILRGDALQDDLRTCLLTQFDAPLVSASHTSARLIADVARRTWISGKGFVRDVR